MPIGHDYLLNNPSFSLSRVMMEPASYRPKVYYTQANLRGIEEPFPYHTS